MRTRTIEVLKKFISVDYPLTIESLSEEFQVSARTLRNEINEINGYLKDHNLPLIQTIRNKGFLLTTTNEEKQNVKQSFCDIKSSVFLSKEERIFDLLLDIAFGEQPVFLCNKEKSFFVSKSVLDEDIRKLKAILKKYDIEIFSFGKQGMVFNGYERSVRVMLYEIINRHVGNLKLNRNQNEISSFHHILFKYIPQYIFEQLLLLAQQKISQINDEIYLNQIVIFTAIWYKRNSQNNHLTITKLDANNSDNSEINNYIQSVIECLTLRPQALELKYIVFMLETFNTKDINNSVEWVNAQLLTIKLVKYVEDKTEIPFSSKEEQLYESLCKHIAGLTARVKNNIHIINPLADNIKQNYQLIYTVINAFMQGLETEFGNKISDDEIAFLTIHFSAFASSINQEQIRYFKAVVFCDHGVATSNLLAEHLKEFFNVEILAILSRSNVSLIDKLDFDLIFSTFPIEHINKPVLVLEPILKENNHQIIADFLDKHQAQQRTTLLHDSTELFYSIINLINESGGVVSASIYKKLENSLESFNLRINKRKVQPMLKDILSDNDIVLNEDCQNWEQAIKTAAKPLLIKQTISQNYIDAMIESVKKHGPYIVIGKHLALAHARPEDGVHQLGISVATMKNPVDFKNPDMGPVKIVFCLAAVDSFSHLNIMRSLIDLINNENKLNKLIESKSIASFKKILFEQ